MFHVKRLEEKEREVVFFYETFEGKGKKQVFHVKRLEKKRERSSVFMKRSKEKGKVDALRETFGGKRKT